MSAMIAEIVTEAPLLVATTVLDHLAVIATTISKLHYFFATILSLAYNTQRTAFLRSPLQR
jgi:hypothetical protein